MPPTRKNGKICYLEILALDIAPTIYVRAPVFRGVGTIDQMVFNTERRNV